MHQIPGAVFFPFEGIVVAGHGGTVEAGHDGPVDVFVGGSIPEGFLSRKINRMDHELSFIPEIHPPGLTIIAMAFIAFHDVK